MDLGTTFYTDFITSNPTTGAVVDADDTPTIAVFEDATDIPMYEPAAVKRTDQTGHYRTRIDVTTVNGFEKGKTYSVVANYEISGTVMKVLINSFIVSDAMEKLTKVAALLNVAVPDTFDPEVDPLDLEEPASLDSQFGASSTHEYRVLFTQYWDAIKNAWKEGADIAVPAEFMAEVNAAQDGINIYNEAKSEWEANYSLQREVQWRAFFAAALIAGTE